LAVPDLGELALVLPAFLLTAALDRGFGSVPPRPAGSRGDDHRPKTD
jgi:hypothetical protein